MNQGLVIGKFMPLHRGHIALINFAVERCDRLTVLIAVNASEPIPGPERLKWMWQTFRYQKDILIEYTDEDLPDAPVSSREVSKVWASFLSGRFPGVRTVFSSEPYGEYLAEYMGIKHVMFDLKREQCPVSASEIRLHPVKHWEWIPGVVRPWFTRKFCIYGPESTGKSTLTEQLAAHFKTGYVPELARDVLGERLVEDLVFEDITAIGRAHAQAILDEQEKGFPFMFCDTDLITTRIYSKQYFHREPEFPPWVEEANRFHHYFFCDTDVPWIKDRHRNLGHLRNKLREVFEEELVKRGIPFTLLSGSWEERFNHAVAVINSLDIHHN